MTLRLTYGLITLLWVVMNFLLWRAESGGSGGSAVPFQQVAQRLLEAADSSTLQIQQDGDPIGQFRWTPTVLHDDASVAHQLADDGMVLHRTGYSIDFELNLASTARGWRGRGNGRCELDADRAWRSLEIRFVQKPYVYNFTAKAAEATGSLRILEGDQVVFEQTFPLNDPLRLLGSLDGALGGFGLLAPGLLTSLSLPLVPGNPGGATTPLPTGLFRWESRSDTLRISQQNVRTFHLIGHFLNRHNAEVWISRDGELLKVSLPGGIEMQDSTAWPATR